MPPILNVYGISIDDHRWTKSLQGIDVSPMGCCPPAIQSTRSGQEERSVTHGCDACHSAHGPGHDVCDGSARKLLAHAWLTADRDQRIDALQAPVRHLRERQISDKSNARRRWEGPRLRGCDLDAIHWARDLIVRARKHLEGTSDIEQLAIGKREQQNVVWGCHGPTFVACAGLF